MAKSKPRKVISMNANKRDVAGSVVHIKNSEVTERKLYTKYAKWQLWLAKLVGITPEDKYQYCFRFQYFGTTRLKVNDIVTNSEKVIFMIIKESNGLAMMVASKPYINKPKVYGNLIIVDRQKPKQIK